MLLLSVLAIVGFAVLPLIAVAVALNTRARARQLESAVDRLEQEVRDLRRGPPATASPGPAATTAPEPPLPAPAPLAPPAAPPMPVAPPTPAPVAAPRTPAPTPAPVPARPRFVSVESIIGGLWLQNVGSVLVLLGVFFLILWGYTTGHIGPGGLVAAAVAAGIVLGWRGDRMARRIAPLGHAMVGVGLGVVYIALYLGHFLLGVLATPVMYSSLAVVSLIALRLGKHYRVKVIEALAVVGAFVPYIAPVLFGGEHAHTAPLPLLAYLAVVNLVVFVRAGEAGFSGLALESLAFSTITWLTAVGDRTWGWGVTAGIAALFLGFGHAPLPRLARDPAPLDPVEAVTLVTAPMLFLVCVSPFLNRLSRHELGMLLLGLAVVEGAAAVWMAWVRERRDAWYGLVTTSVLFVTFAVERLLGSTLTPLVWTVEGIALLALGLGASSAWLRGLGVAVTFLGVFVSALRVAPGLLVPPPTLGVGLPAIVTASYVRGLVETVALFAGHRLYRAHRAALGPDEARVLPPAFGALAHTLLFACIGRLALRAAGAFVALEQVSSGLGVGEAAALPGARAMFIGGAVACAGWSVHAAWLLFAGVRRGDGAQRAYGYAVLAGAAMVALTTLIGGATDAVWIPGDAPVVHPAGPFLLLFLLMGFALASHLDRRRAHLPALESRVSEVLTVAMNLLLLGWTAQQAGRLAHRLPADPHVNLAAVGTSVAWITQAVVLVALGWGKSNGLLRWTGLVLLGVTLLKVLFLDLAEVGVFWRFVIAIGFGVVLMVVSYAYQRSQRAAAEAHAPDALAPDDART